MRRILKKIIGGAEIQDGEIPPWWMGIAYTDYLRNVEVYYAVPLHHFVWLAWKINYIWCRYRLRESWIDREIKKVIEADRIRTTAEKTKLKQIILGNQLMFAAIVLKHGGSMRINNLDIKMVPPNCVIVKDRNDFGTTYTIEK